MKIRIIPIIGLLLGVYSCEQAIEPETAYTPKEVQFSVSATALTRSGKEIFVLGDAIGIYAVKRSNAAIPVLPGLTGNQAHNAKWVKTEEGWRPDTPYDKVIWPQEGESVDFYAYYPYQQTAMNPTQIEMAVLSEQTTSQKLQESDVLRAVNANGQTEGVVDLKFDHLFTLASVQLSSDNFDVNTPAEVTVNNIATKVSINLGTGVQTPLLTGSIIMLNTDDGTPAYQAIIPVQDIPAGTSLLHCDLDGISYIYHTAENIHLQAGEIQPFNIKLK